MGQESVDESAHLPTQGLPSMPHLEQGANSFTFYNLFIFYNQDSRDAKVLSEEPYLSDQFMAQLEGVCE